MKTIGLLGGMSWESTATYYRAINEGIKKNLGGLHSAKILLYSVDFAEIEELQHLDRWVETAEILGSAAQRLETGGADFILICTNTMHKVAPEIEATIEIPLLHIADATAEEIKEKDLSTVGLLGTRFTMEQDFYKGRLEKVHGIKVLVPGSEDREIVHQVIYDELCQGIISTDSRNEFVRIIKMLYKQGAEAVILGCTEIALLVQQEHTNVPLFDTTRIHAKKAVEAAILC
ncbi:MAG: aspartate/glutamate racemase family protein [Deltaproteobacteria bacterium]|jgi:aspartate racemase|nr:aspartate/glutamate racemase family protein [Deltaproteobacteria bacterium]MBT4267387.1 aspartate/glutamate racemase family protein [Deltaproteobacteria bacterium]MBT4638065.1 aspartate/glutamate racemase family protein [Deltaproteobacteria bacterium]MBT6612792.1 aspartate/glutamate racemase family protein [Deltaproteobacteria bacterium]MBT7155146.1 aspartate/glutamate racemase family protein [Deltaproteobacteria bacterium]